MGKEIIIIGAGVAGLSAALAIANAGKHCLLISTGYSERAQSNLAAGGINVDFQDPLTHYMDTMQTGAYLANDRAVKNLTNSAPEVIEFLQNLGVPFQMNGTAPVLRKLGGHRVSRTVFAGSITGKAIMAALIDEVRKQEMQGHLKRFSHHRCIDFVFREEKECNGCKIQDLYSNKIITLYGSVILASGGMSGLLPGHCTGAVENDAYVTAAAFSQGVKLANLEFIQYHPTTVSIFGKKHLLSEAVRSEGGRFFTIRDGNPWYFLEEFYGKQGNLISRDRVVREMWNILQREDCEQKIYLDMRGIEEEKWNNSLFGMKEICEEYSGMDPGNIPIPIQPGIHYFMGGILVDEKHRTNIPYLYAAGECACIYHGASRLGGNSLLGAVYGGQVAAKSALEEMKDIDRDIEVEESDILRKNHYLSRKIGDQLYKTMSIIRNEESLQRGKEALSRLLEQVSGFEKKKVLLGMAMIQSAIERKESRGAHIRSDYPQMREAFKKATVAWYDGEQIHIEFERV